MFIRLTLKNNKFVYKLKIIKYYIYFKIFLNNYFYEKKMNKKNNIKKYLEIKVLIILKKQIKIEINLFD